jgi:hypothetical protein
MGKLSKYFSLNLIAFVAGCLLIMFLTKSSSNTDIKDLKLKNDSLLLANKKLWLCHNFKCSNKESLWSSKSEDVMVCFLCHGVFFMSRYSTILYKDLESTILYIIDFNFLVFE